MLLFYFELLIAYNDGENDKPNITHTLQIQMVSKLKFGALVNIAT